MVPARLQAMRSRLFWWAFVGAGGTVLYAVLTFAGVRLLNLPAVLASVGAYALAAAWSYVGHRRLTFRSRQPHRETLARFSALSLAGYGLAMAIPAACSVLGARIEASILATCIAVPTMNYVVMSRMVFR